MAQYVGMLYRGIAVDYQDDPLSGEGARLYGGRFNPPGLDTLYTAVSARTALDECMQGIGELEPLTLVSYSAEIDDLLNLTTEALATDAGFDWKHFSDPEWRLAARKFGVAPSQLIGREVDRRGHSGMMVRSFAPGVTTFQTNIVLFDWGDAPPRKLVLLDSKDQLGKRKRAGTIPPP